jgi:hypothetical protein
MQKKCWVRAQPVTQQIKPTHERFSRVREKFVVSGLSVRSKRDIPVAYDAIHGIKSLPYNPDTTNCFSIIIQKRG